MGDVIDFRGGGASLEGPAFCTRCEHRWQAVVPVGGVTDRLECPECRLWFGVLGAPVVPDWYWLCNCGSPLFYLTYQGARCRACGLISTDWADE